ncbi:MAG: hypothetical protein KME46_31820 [Brasilonema angustatum HA4187-MV1]|jgi:hypothetical protein|nr:hypothetical protein [Brasilonema angustatum HA4187-MV1]
MSQYIFILDFIILKSEIVSVEFDFEPSQRKRFNTLTTDLETENMQEFGKSTIQFILKDGSTRVISKYGYSEKLAEIKADIISQMKAEAQPKVTTSKTTTLTAIKRVPARFW